MTSTAMGKVTPIYTKMYYLYTYNSPVGVMSLAEAVIFNSVVLSSLLLTMYWILVVFPVWAARIFETMYYYSTGKTISVGLFASIYFSRNLIWPPNLAVTMPQAAPNITRIGRERLGF